MDIESLASVETFYLQVPASYHQIPLLSELISKFHIQVNIKAALLSKNAAEGGWFELELIGGQKQVQDSLHYLEGLGLRMWKDQQDDWGWTLSPTS